MTVDHDSNTPPSLQIKAQIEYSIACSELQPGTQLPSVRELATQLRVAPVTVFQAYQRLKEERLIASQSGRGTFVVRKPGIYIEPKQIQHFEVLIDTLIMEAQSLGFNILQLQEQIATHWRVSLQENHKLKVAVIGIFQEPTRSYANDLNRMIGNLAELGVFTIDDIEQDPAERNRLQSFDLLVTFPHYVLKLKQLVGAQVPVTDLHFIPSEHTRTSLAKLVSQTRLLGVAIFPEFLTLLKLGIERFAPHVRHTRYAVLGDPKVKELVRQCQVVVYATGAESVRKLLGGEVQQSFEYRHVPDSAFVEEYLLPLIRSISMRTG